MPSGTAGRWAPLQHCTIGALSLVLLAASACEEAPTAVTPLPGPAASIVLTPTSLRLIVGQGWVIRAAAFDARGRLATAAFDWSTSDPLVATVGKTDGVVTAVSPGLATVTAAAGALQASVSVLVISPGNSVMAFTRLSLISNQSYQTTSNLMVLYGEAGVSVAVAGSESLAITSPTWAPDGTRLVVGAVHGAIGEGAGYPGQGMLGFEEPSDLFLLPQANADQSRWVQLTHDGWSRFPDWSPDGSRIVYVSGPPGQSHLYIHTLDDGPAVRLTTTEGYYATPRWSPDGRWIAFSARVVTFDDVFVMNADGSGLINVTRHPAADAGPSWSPDGRRLAFSSDRDGPYSDVYIIDLESSALHRVTVQETGISNELPAWSPDGAQIAFSRVATTQAANPGIYLVDTDGSHLLQLSAPTHGWTDHFPAWRR